jgi:hypothetical protein
MGLWRLPQWIAAVRWTVVPANCEVKVGMQYNVGSHCTARVLGLPHRRGMHARTCPASERRNYRIYVIEPTHTLDCGLWKPTLQIFGSCMHEQQCSTTTKKKVT